MNFEYLFALQEHSLWVKGHTFMIDTVNNHGGWLTYFGAYLTQYFYYPWLGSTILIAAWGLIYFFILKITAIKGSLSFVPLLLVAYFPYQVLSLGYAVYYSKEPGFAFEPTIVFLCISFVCYTLSLFVKTSDKKLRIRTLSTFTILLLFSVLTNMHLCRHHNFAITTQDKNFRHELKMYRAVDECRWQDVLNEAPKVGDVGHVHPTNLMVMFKNIALLNTDQLLDKAFEYDNATIPPYTGDSTKVKLAYQAGALLYYFHGFTNYAYRHAIENSVKNYPTADILKMLTRCAIFNQEFDVAMKYITLLKCTTFHRKWALEHEAMIWNNRLFIDSEEYRCVSPLLCKEDELDNDQSNVMEYLLSYYSNYNSSDEKIEALSLIYSLQIQHEEEFMIHFYNYAQNHPESPAPKVIQEGAYLIGPTELSPIDVSQYPFDMMVKSTFAQFNQDYHDYMAQGLDDKQVAEKMRTLYGTTYWWYYYFHTDFKFY